MPIIEPCIRPPGEAQSILLQVTTGCSCNSCTFCGAYKQKKFSVKSMREIYADIDVAAVEYPAARKLFLMDGDAMVVANGKLLPILARIRERLPQVRRVSSYANGCTITPRSSGELRELASAGLTLMYMGLESGCQKILDACEKRSTVQQMVSAATMAAEAGIQTSLMVLLGLGGKKNSRDHVEQTASAINAMQPRFLSFLTLMIIPGTRLFEQMKAGEFEPLDQRGFVQETYELLKRLDLRQTHFAANHASNYLPLQGRLPQSRQELLHLCEEALVGRRLLKPEFLRGL